MVNFLLANFSQNQRAAPLLKNVQNILKADPYYSLHISEDAPPPFENV